MSGGRIPVCEPALTAGERVKLMLSGHALSYWSSSEDYPGAVFNRCTRCSQLIYASGRRLARMVGRTREDVVPFEPCAGGQS